MTEISSINGEADFQTVPEVCPPEENFQFDEPTAIAITRSTPPGVMDIKQKVLSRELQIEHCRRFVALHCNHHPDVMAALDTAIQSWKDLFEPHTLERLLSAVEFAAEKHLFQTRKNPEKTPYIIHPIGVAQITLEIGKLKDPDALIAALLHDTLEDTETTTEEIESLFGSDVLKLVRDLTNPSNLKGKALKAAQIAHAPYMHDDAKVIKLADRYYNVCDLATIVWEQEKIDGYMLWGAKLAQVLRGTNPGLEQAIDSKVSAHFQSRFPSNVEIGQLGERWQFPSDHLPVGAYVDGIEMASWNVLNTAYMSWVEELNTQGLKGSLITTANQVVDGATGLTLRDQLTVQAIVKMISHPTHPKQLISLQECGPAFLQELKNALPDHMQIVYTQETPKPRNQDIVVIDTRQLKLKTELVQVDYPYACSPGRPVINLVLEKGDKSYRLINAHLPGDPTLPGKEEFAAYVNGFSDDVVLAMGDMNFTRDEMQSAFLNQGGQNLPFSLISSYPTNLGLDLKSKAIDHIYVKGTFDWDQRYPEEVMQELASTVNLLTQQC